MEKSLLLLLLSCAAEIALATLPYGGKIPAYVYYQPTSVANKGNCAPVNSSVPCSPDYWSVYKATCGVSYTSQSPIDVTTSTTTLNSTLKELVLSHVGTCDEGVQLWNNNHTFEVGYEGCLTAFTITWGGLVYQLNQFHFHAPSENTIDGKFFDAEVHLVHKNAADPNKIVVIGVMLNKVTDNSDTFFSQFFKPNFTKVASTLKGDFNPYDSLLPAPRSYYKFAGSLTTPPCTVVSGTTTYPVTWILMQKSMPVSAAFANKMTQTLIHTVGSQVGPTGANNRPVQPLNGRKILKFVSVVAPAPSTNSKLNSAPKKACYAVASIVAVLAFVLV